MTPMMGIMVALTVTEGGYSGLTLEEPTVLRGKRRAC